MKRLSSTLLLLAISFSIYSQQDFGFKLSGGISKIIPGSKPIEEGIELTFKYPPSLQAGFFYECDFGKKSTIGAELLFIQMSSKEIIASSYIPWNSRIPITERLHQDLQASYLSLPVYYRFKINRLSLLVGWQTSIHLTNHYNLYYDEGSSSKIISGGEGKADLNSFDYGPKAGIMYNLSKRFAIDASYYYGLPDIISDGGWNLITAGVRYKFWIRDKKEKVKEEM